MMIDQERFDKTIASFDAANAKDPNIQTIYGVEHPKELLYAQRLSTMLDRYVDDASEALQLAARCQHIQRWMKPRADYPMTKPGYMQWRTHLRIYHALVAETILRENEYDDAMVQKVCSLLKKELLRKDNDAQILQDVIVLVFLESELEGFVQKYSDYSEEKFISILRKSLNKMSEKGREAALTLIKLPPSLLPVIKKAAGIN